jgi:hypothetical protein
MIMLSTINNLRTFEKHYHSPTINENQFIEIVSQILIKVAIDVVSYRLNSYW